MFPTRQSSNSYELLGQLLLYTDEVKIIMERWKRIANEVAATKLDGGQHTI
jgi:hypothetical protein